MKQVITAIIFLVLAVSLLAAGFTIRQVEQERARLTNDLQYRTTLLAESFKETIEPNFINKSDAYLQSIVERFANRERFAGLAVYTHAGDLIAASSSLAASESAILTLVNNAMDEDTYNDTFLSATTSSLYLLATPLRNEQSIVGALVVAQHANYIDTRIYELWRTNMLRLFAQILLIALALLLIIRWLIFEPIRTLTSSIRLARNENNTPPTPFSLPSLFAPLTQEVSSMRQSLIEARIAAAEEAKASLEKMDAPWTAQRLKEFIRDTAKDRKIVVVSNREPYIHEKKGSTISYHTPASGMVTALEPVVQAAEGTWVAHGSGTADRLVVNTQNRIAVPPDDPKYTLRRVWLTKEEEHHYYDGFCNEGLWPLCHTAYTRPVFRKEDWEEYQRVNRTFAHAVLTEIQTTKQPIVLVQDFHFALLPKLIKQARPDATVGIYWHIPWVSAEAFSICPWKKEILDGILGSDLIGFHTQLHCNNFIETVSRELESLINYEQFSVTRHNHVSFIKPFPISIAFSKTQTDTSRNYKTTAKQKNILKHAGIHTPYVGVGIDRLDYTKGILERLKAIELLLTRYPQYVEKFTFAQIAAPTRTRVPRYKEFALEVEKEVERINTMFQTRTWKPIVLIHRHHNHEEIDAWYKAADVCLVTSLHDGMNLVAKEFVASREDNKGVLVLSQFAGASKELKDALIINPYNGEETAAAIQYALSMTPAEQTKRMKKLRDIVRRHNIYRWSADMLRTLVTINT
jgi:alpha,alpha-trehalose-phosphate synthase [UDP-forming]